MLLLFLRTFFHFLLVSSFAVEKSRAILIHGPLLHELFSFLVFYPIRAAQAAYGGSLARGLIGAIATWDPSCV